MSVERETVRVESDVASDPVEVRVTADPKQLPVLRAVVGDLAMRADFDVDSVADLRLAVDEACSSLVRLALSGSQLCCRFHTGTDRLSVTAEVTSEDEFGPRQDTFSWRVLSALTDDVSASVHADTATDGTYQVRIELTKGRTATREAS